MTGSVGQSALDFLARASGTEATEVYHPSSEDECAVILHGASRSGMHVVPVGGATTLHASELRLGKRYAVLAMKGMRSNVDARGADSVVTCPAGVPFGELHAVLAEQNQRLPIDPPASHTATVGGVVAANAYGLLRCSHGPVGDSVVALRMVTGSGEVATAGAKVVKNTAGYDLCRLLTGSRGTLALITEVTFRLQPVPPAEAHLAFKSENLEDAARTAWRLTETYPGLSYVAVTLGAEGCSGPVVLCGMSGPARHVHTLQEAVEAEAGRCGFSSVPTLLHDGLAESARRTLQGCGTGPAVRLSVPRAHAIGIVSALAPMADRLTWLVPCGIVAVGLEEDGRNCAARLAEALPHVLRGPASVRWLQRPEGTHLSGVAGSQSYRSLLRRLKAAFDPAGILCPGLLESVL